MNLRIQIPKSIIDCRHRSLIANMKNDKPTKEMENEKTKMKINRNNNNNNWTLAASMVKCPTIICWAMRKKCALFWLPSSHFFLFFFFFCTSFGWLFTAYCSWIQWELKIPFYVGHPCFDTLIDLLHVTNKAINCTHNITCVFRWFIVVVSYFFLFIYFSFIYDHYPTFSSDNLSQYEQEQTHTFIENKTTSLKH